MAITVVLEIADTGLISFANSQARGKTLEGQLVEYLVIGAKKAGYSPAKK